MGFGTFAIPILVALTILVFLCFILIWVRNYKKIDPNMVAIITGRKRKLPDGKFVGYRIVKGGATLVMPVLEQIKYLPLSLMTLSIRITKAYNKDGVPVNLEAVANVKIKSEDVAISNAVERFLGDDPSKKMRETTEQTLEGHLRSIVGTLTMEELNSDRKAFAGRVTEESVVDLEKMGVGVDSIVIKSIADEHEYLESLGRKRTAEVKRDADIGKAEAERDAKIATSNATKEAELIAAQNGIAVADAIKKKDVQVAQFLAETDREKATAAQAGALAAAEIDKKVRQAKVAAEAAETESRIALATQETARVEKQLQYTQIKPAEAESQAQVIRSNAQKQSGIIDAEKDREIKLINADAQFRAAEQEAQAIRTKAEAEANAAQKRGEGDAAAKKAQLLAEAEGEKAKLIAVADGKKADLMAEADGDRAKRLAVAEGQKQQLLAEAEGKEKLAEALKKLDETGKLLQILAQIPEVAPAVGKALAMALGPDGFASIFGQIAQPMANIDSIRVYDFGGNGNSGNGSAGNANSLMKFAGLAPEVVFNFLAKAQALGLDKAIAKHFGGLVSEILESSATDQVAGKT